LLGHQILQHSTNFPAPVTPISCTPYQLTTPGPTHQFFTILPTSPRRPLSPPGSLRPANNRRSPARLFLPPPPAVTGAAPPPRRPAAPSLPSPTSGVYYPHRRRARFHPLPPLDARRHTSSSSSSQRSPSIPISLRQRPSAVRPMLPHDDSCWDGVWTADPRASTSSGSSGGGLRPRHRCAATSLPSPTRSPSAGPGVAAGHSPRPRGGALLPARSPAPPDPAEVELELGLGGDDDSRLDEGEATTTSPVVPSSSSAPTATSGST
jgi:hypothetical protein